MALLSFLRYLTLLLEVRCRELGEATVDLYEMANTTRKLCVCVSGTRGLQSILKICRRRWVWLRFWLFQTLMCLLLYYGDLSKKRPSVARACNVITRLGLATSPIVLKFSSFTNLPLTDTTHWAQFLKDYSPNGFKQNMNHQDFYKFLKIEPRFLQRQWSFRVWKSLPGPVRDYLFTVTVTIILKAWFLAVLKKRRL